MLMTERIQQKLTTIAKIAQVYCRACHAKRTGLCEECAELLDYVSLRLSHCPFLPDRPVCAKCLAHCYKADKREKIHRVMRFAGPRMIFVDPAAAIRHLISLRSKPSPAVRQAMKRRELQQKTEDKNAP